MAQSRSLAANVLKQRNMAENKLMGKGGRGRKGEILVVPAEKC
jgi:hypothetical protein